MPSQKTKIKASLYLNYFVFAILLNSVGIVILKVQKNYGVDEVQASILELFKDMPIAIVSFLVASFLPRWGYKNAMLTAMGIVTFACIGMYFADTFWATKLLFLSIGTAFALIKVSVYSTIGLVTDTDAQHNSLMSNIEGFFMFGITLAYFLFPFFNKEEDPSAWLNTYLLLAVLSSLSFLFLYFSKFDTDIEVPGSNLKEDFTAMFKLMLKLLVIVFVLSAFLFVMIEQGIMTWLPTFNARVLQIPENLAIMMSSILAISLGMGRFMAGFLVRKIHWYWVLLGCLLTSMSIVYFVLPQAIELKLEAVETLADIPFLGYAFPIVGLFIAPIYPLINSAILTALPKKLHSSMTGLIIIFSAIGGTLGSRAIGYLFKNMGADKAFTYTLIPMVALLITLTILKSLIQKAKTKNDEY